MNKIDHLEITVSKYDPDIIGITESWCTPSVPDSELQLNTVITSYFATIYRDSDNKGGGVLLYVESKRKPQETKDQVWCTLFCLLTLVFAIVLRITLLLVLTRAID